MGGRGTFAARKSVDYTYETVGFIEGVKVLRGLNGKHGLPESAHSSTAYIKLDHNGVFKEMRFMTKITFCIWRLAITRRRSWDRLINQFCTIIHMIRCLAKQIAKGKG